MPYSSSDNACRRSHCPLCHLSRTPTWPPLSSPRFRLKPSAPTCSSGTRAQKSGKTVQLWKLPITPGNVRREYDAPVNPTPYNPQCLASVLHNQGHLHLFVPHYSVRTDTSVAPIINLWGRAFVPDSGKYLSSIWELRLFYFADRRTRKVDIALHTRMMINVHRAASGVG